MTKIGNKRAGILINPVSGGSDKKPLLELIRRHFPKNIDYELIFWERPEQREELIQRIRESKYDIVVAAGGDGTINQVARAIKDTGSQLAIIPLGSGNGLARHLKIPLDTKKAIELIGSGKVVQIDACTVNGQDFFCTSGLGFDALIGKLFAESKTRGFLTYLFLTVSSFFSYKPQAYMLDIDGRRVETLAFLITFANGSQYGNNVYIAPQADISDGFIDIMVLKPISVWDALRIAPKMFNKTLHKSRYVDVYKGRSITVSRTSAGPVHLDGEPAELESSVLFLNNKCRVNVLVPA
jgi:diacylglycerol kinase (ATP)